jgi:signal transduction histidine kinase
MIDLADIHNSPQSLHIIFANSALRACPSIFDSIQLLPESPYVNRNSEKAERFYRWLLSFSTDGKESADIQEHSFGNAVWTCSTLRGRIRIISATQTVHSLTDEPSKLPQFMSRSTPSLSIEQQSQHSHRTPVSTAVFSAHEGSDYFGPRSYASPVLDSPASGSRRGNPDDSAWKGTITSHPNGSPDQEVGFFDWTRIISSELVPLHIQFARSIDWASTALGPMSGWSAHLREMCNLIMASPHPAAMYWGPEWVAIYNEAYVPLAGQKHPTLMGQRYADAWSEIWEQLEVVFREARETGQATMKDDDRLFINRYNYLEETFFSWSIIPIVGEDGRVIGLYNPCFEKTTRKIAERRMITLREVGERTAMARDVKGFWREVRFGLEINKYDTPFVLLYSVSEESDSDASSIMSGSLMGSKQCFLEGTLGVPEAHECAPQVIELRSGNEGFGPLFREAMRADGPIVVRVTGVPEQEHHAHLPEDPNDFHSSIKGSYEIPFEMLDGIEWRGFGDACRSVVVCKVLPTTGDNVLGFFVLGINPRRPYDEDYNLFVQLLTRQVATSLASVVLFEEEIKRGQRAAQLAALDRIQLSEQLEQRTQEARDLEIRFTHMAELSPAGLFIADAAGKISYCNDSWYEISGIPKDLGSADRWIDFVVDSDQPRVQSIWSKLLQDHESATAEFRFKKRWVDKSGQPYDTWVLFSAHPEMVPGLRIDGQSETLVRSLFCNLTDISSQKRAQAFEKQRMEEAVEMKRQQENFIDITSHEMRNPLSAILQCADNITVSLGEMLERQEQKQLLPKSEIEHLASSIDAADTIILCAQHQKRIVDDVLTLSKLDSHMLTVAPVDVQPLNIMSRVLKMFEPQTASAGISLNMIVDESIGRLGVDWVRLDPQRVSQVLINLLSNAIKFTENQQRIVAASASPQITSTDSLSGLNHGEGTNSDIAKGTSITVSIAAYAEEPINQPDPVVKYFIYRRTPEQHITGEAVDTSRDNTQSAAVPLQDIDDPSSDWGTGDKIYLQFCVTDTGPGLKDSEKKLLFNRFTQASPRTHVTYGGSGLGLFISRELCELLGGKIGVASKYGKGSTFAFYVRASKSKEPEEREDREMAIPANLKNVVGVFGEGKTRRTAAIVTNQNPGLPSLTEGALPRASSGAASVFGDQDSHTRSGRLSVLVVEVSAALL